MKSANNEVATARNTPSPIFAAGRVIAPVPGKSIDRTFFQPGFGCQPLLREPPSDDDRYHSHEQDDGAHGAAP